MKVVPPSILSFVPCGLVIGLLVLSWSPRLYGAAPPSPFPR